MNRLDIVCFGAVALGMAALLFEQHAKTRLSERNRLLRAAVEQSDQLAPAGRHPLSLPRPQVAFSSAAPGGGPSQELLQLRRDLRGLRRDRNQANWLQTDNARLHTNWVQRLKAGNKLSLEQVESYLKAKQRSAGSLLAAAELTGDQTLLREALNKYPSDRQVVFAACTSGQATPEERRECFELFKQLAPDNALANYLSAQAYFKSGQTAEAVQELIAASGKPRFQDYSWELLPAVEEGYQAAGLSPLEAAALASGQCSLRSLGYLNALGSSLGDLAQRYLQAGDDTSAQSAVAMAVALGRKVGDLGNLTGELVGLAIEQRTLKTLDPTSAYDASGDSVEDRLNQLAQRKAEIRALCGQADEAIKNLSEPDLASFYERFRTVGELEAFRWVLSRPQPK